MLKNKILPTIVLSVICITVALVLAVANIFTAPLIEKNQNEATQKALRDVYPEGNEFEKLDLSKHSFPEEIERRIPQTADTFSNAI